MEGVGDSGAANVKAEGSQPINIVVRDQGGTEVHFKIKTTTQFKKVIQAYCEKKSLDPQHVKFVVEGERVKDTDTPAGLEMEDGDAVDVLVEQIGGGH